MNVTMRNATIGVVAIVLLAALLLLTPPPGGLWLRTFYDATHVPLFGMIAVGALFMTPRRWGLGQRFLVTAATVVVLAALTEIAQIPTARDASLVDLSADLMGGIGCLCIAVGVVRSFAVARLNRALLVLLGLVLVAIPLAPLANVSAAYIERARAVPGLVRFDSRRGALFIRVRNAELTRIPGPGPGDVSARIVLGDGRWPGITFSDVWPDWSGYDALAIDVENPEAADLPMTVRIDDWDHRDSQSPDDRFNRRVTLAPGRQTVRIGIDDIRDAPADRTMNLERIDRVILFATPQQAGRAIVLHDIRLARADDDRR